MEIECVGMLYKFSFGWLSSVVKVLFVVQSRLVFSRLFFLVEEDSGYKLLFLVIPVVRLCLLHESHIIAVFWQYISSAYFPLLL